IAKHTKKGTLPGDIKSASDLLPAERSAKASRFADGRGSSETVARGFSETVARGFSRAEPDARGSSDAGARGFSRAEPDAAESMHAPKPPKVTMPPLPEPESTAKAPAERRKGDYTLPPLALLDAPKTERKVDERELMDGA